MPNEFRFFLVCLGAIQRLDDHLVNLSGIVNDLDATPSEPVQLAAVVGLILRQEMTGKRLDLMVWKLDEKGKPQKFGDYVGTPLILPSGYGAHVLPYSITIPIVESGIYGFYLFDRDGAFGPKENLLATYMFGVTAK